MASILGTTWKIQKVTDHTPFKQGAGTVVVITQDSKVKFDGGEWQGSYDASKNKLTVTGLATHWEFVGSEEKEIGSPPKKFFVMYGSSWTTTLPDAMGTWVSDPQGTP